MSYTGPKKCSINKSDSRVIVDESAASHSTLVDQNDQNKIVQELIRSSFGVLIKLWNQLDPAGSGWIHLNTKF